MIQRLGLSDVEEIHSAIEYRQDNFTGESREMSLGVVLLNYGSKHTGIACINGEWSGIKGDLRPGTGGIPRCPNGHVMTETDGGMQLALVDAEPIGGEL